MNHHAWLLAERHADEVVFVKCAEVNVHAAFIVGECHLKQGGDQAACRHVVTCEDEFLLDELLQSVEALLKVFSINDIGCIVADSVDDLSEAAASEFECVFREVDVQNLGVFIVDNHWLDGFSDVGDFACCCHDDGARGKHLLAVLVFLGHRQ